LSYKQTNKTKQNKREEKRGEGEEKEKRERGIKADENKMDSVNKWKKTEHAG
jgi:hypothetical protein